LLDSLLQERIKVYPEKDLFTVKFIEKSKIDHNDGG